MRSPPPPDSPTELLTLRTQFGPEKQAIADKVFADDKNCTPSPFSPLCDALLITRTNRQAYVCSWLRSRICR